MEEEDDGPLLVIVASPLFREVDLEAVGYAAKFDSAIEEAGLLGMGLLASRRWSFCSREGRNRWRDTPGQTQHGGQASDGRSKKTEHINDSDAGR
jgi:hypothetical protein